MARESIDPSTETIKILRNELSVTLKNLEDQKISNELSEKSRKEMISTFESEIEGLRGNNLKLEELIKEWKVKHSNLFVRFYLVF
jgi:hypothetical protein